MVANIVLYLVFWWSQTEPDPAWTKRLHALAGDPRTAPWSLLTFCLLEPHLLVGAALPDMFYGVVLVLMVAFVLWIGGDLEKSWGVRRYGWFLAGTSAASYLVVYTVTGHALTGLAPLAANLFLAWLTQNAEYELRVMFMFTLRLGFFRWVTLGLVLLSSLLYVTHPLLGLSSLAGPLLSWWWARKLRPLGARPQFQLIQGGYEDDEDDEDQPTWADTEIDRILDKIRAEGMSSLTAQERDLLDARSSQLRRS